MLDRFLARYRWAMGSICYYCLIVTGLFHLQLRPENWAFRRSTHSYHSPLQLRHPRQRILCHLARSAGAILVSWLREWSRSWLRGQTWSVSMGSWPSTLSGRLGCSSCKCVHLHGSTLIHQRVLHHCLQWHLTLASHALSDELCLYYHLHECYRFIFLYTNFKF